MPHRLHSKVADELSEINATGGRRRSLLNDAWREHEQRRSELKASLMRAEDVDQQRAALEAAERDFAAAHAALTAAQGRVNVAEAQERVIDHVLAYGAARSELAAIDEQGARLEPDELARYRQWIRDRDAARDAEAGARQAVVDLRAQIGALEIDQRVLDTAAPIEAVASARQARLEGIDQLRSRHLPEAEQHERELRDLLAQLGVDISDGLEPALQRSRVAVDLARTLDDLADRTSQAEDARRTHRAARDEAVSRLAARGIQLDLEAGQLVPESEAVTTKRAVTSAQAGVQRAEDELRRVRMEIEGLESEQGSASLVARVTMREVQAARGTRDSLWSDIRGDWTGESTRSLAERLELAELFTGLIRSADEAGDHEASERAEVAARRALAEQRDKRLGGLTTREAERTEVLRRAEEALRSAELAWIELWERAGLDQPPAVDATERVIADVIALHQESMAIRAAEEGLAELRGPWAEVARDAGLPDSATPTTWHARAAALQEIERKRASLDRVRSEIHAIEARWTAYRAKAASLLEELTDAALPSDEHELGSAVRALRARLTTQRELQAKAETLKQQVATEKEREQKAIERGRHAREQLDALRAARGADDGELMRMAARADDASGPLRRMAEALESTRAAWPQRVALEVVELLESRDRASVEAELARTRETRDEAQATEGRLREERREQKVRLDQVSTREGADEALVKVRQTEAKIAELSRRWLSLRLQEEMLKRVIVRQGEDEALPLLTEAGEILDRFTGGRWVALQPAEGHGPRALRVLRADGTPAGPRELSEGTLDQVYLALRLAAVRELHRQRTAEGKRPVPLVLDDVLMAFDAERTREALAVLTELARDFQIIVFTHHAYVADEARVLGGVQVSELPVPNPIATDAAPDQIRAAAARPQPVAVTAPPAAGTTSTGGSETDSGVIRAWAEAQGLMERGRRGRIPLHVRAQYERAHGLG